MFQKFISVLLFNKLSDLSRQSDFKKTQPETFMNSPGVCLKVCESECVDVGIWLSYFWVVLPIVINKISKESLKKSLQNVHLDLRVD